MSLRSFYILLVIKCVISVAISAQNATTHVEATRDLSGRHNNLTSCIIDTLVLTRVVASYRITHLQHSRDWRFGIAALQVLVASRRCRQVDILVQKLKRHWAALVCGGRAQRKSRRGDTLPERRRSQARLVQRQPHASLAPNSFRARLRPRRLLVSC